jgi:hypothetical protein
VAGIFLMVEPQQLSFAEESLVEAIRQELGRKKGVRFLKNACNSYRSYIYFGMKKSTQTSRNVSASIESSLQQLEHRHRALLAELADIGLTLRGSIGLRLNRCGNPTCRCKADPPKLHGPYYKWTRKVAGKTVSATLTPEQAARFKEWVQNMRDLERIVRQIQGLGFRAAELVMGEKLAINTPEEETEEDTRGDDILKK